MNKNIKKVVFFDVDNTIIDGYTQKYFIHYLFKNKIIGIKILLFSYLWFFLYKFNIVSNVDKAISFYISFLKGWKVDDLNNIIEDFFQKKIYNNFFKVIVNIIKDFKSEGAQVVLVSTSLGPIVKIIADNLGVNKIIATKLEVEDGVYTGFIKGRAVAGREKLRLVQDFLSSFEDIKTYFYSDHFSDESLLAFVDKPSVVNPDKLLYNKAKKNNWNIINVTNK